MKKNIKAISLILSSFIIPLLMEKFLYSNESFSVIRFSIVLISLLALSAFILLYKKKKIDFLFKYRYIIGVIAFSILVIFGFHGSSISLYNQVVQPNNIQSESDPIVGKSRTIRGDEWAVSTPTILSQTNNDFSEISNILNAKKSNITLFPKIVSRTLGIIATPNQIGFLFLPKEQAFSFSWFFGYFLLFYAALELLMLITKKNKLYSILGAFLITLSPVVQWWEAWNIIAYGCLAIVLFDRYLKSKKIFSQILLAFIIGIIGSCYIMCIYPAWQIPYGFLFLILSIWICKQNKENCSLKKILGLIFIILLVVGLIVVPIFINSYDIYKIISNTAYPGKRVSNGGFGWFYLFNYLSSIFNSFRESSNASEMSQFISLYPIPIIMGIYYWYSNKKKYKKDFLLVGLTLLVILLTIWNYVELPAWLSKISLLSMSTPIRCANVSSFICVLLLIYCISNYENEKFEGSVKYHSLIISILVVLLGVYVVKTNYTNYISNCMIIADIIIFIPIIYIFMLNYKTFNKAGLILLTTLTVVTGICVHPLNIGLKEIYDKPISKEIKKLEEKDSDADWATIDTPYYMQNYLVANGADTLNSTNYYPNFDLWEKLNLQQYEDIYNRYAHLIINITNEKSYVKLNYEDQIQLELNNDDVCKLDLEYLLTTGKELEEYSSNRISFNRIYNEDGVMIYSVDCK